MLVTQAALSSSLPLIIPITPGLYEALHGRGTAPDCTASTELYSDGVCRYETVIKDDGSQVYVDDRRNLFCDHAQLVAHRSTASNWFDKQI